MAKHDPKKGTMLFCGEINSAKIGCLLLRIFLVAGPSKSLEKSDIIDRITQRYPELSDRSVPYMIKKLVEKGFLKEFETKKTVCLTDKGVRCATCFLLHAFGGHAAWKRSPCYRDNIGKTDELIKEEFLEMLDTAIGTLVSTVQILVERKKEL